MTEALVILDLLELEFCSVFTIQYQIIAIDIMESCLDFSAYESLLCLADESAERFGIGCDKRNRLN